MSYWEGVFTNFMLTALARVIGNVSELNKPLTGGETIPSKTFWKEYPMTQTMKSLFDGSAFNAFLFCVS